MLNRLLILAILGGLLPLGAGVWWVFDLTSHFRLQYLALALLLLIAALWRRRGILALLLAGAMLINAWPVVPYLPLTKAQAAGDEAFSVLNVNVNSDNTAYDTIIKSIRMSGADIVTVIELTPELARRVAAIAEYPYRETAPSAGRFGLGILSKHEILASELIDLGPVRAVSATIALPERQIEVLAVHVMPPVSAALAATRNQQLEQLADSIRETTGPLIVCGDFNMSPYSPFFPRFEASSGARGVRRGLGIDFSWPSFMPLLGVPIDHCFTRGRLGAASVERLPSPGSDHYPVRVGLFWQETG